MMYKQNNKRIPPPTYTPDYNRPRPPSSLPPSIYITMAHPSLDLATDGIGKIVGKAQSSFFNAQRSLEKLTGYERYHFEIYGEVDNEYKIILCGGFLNGQQVVSVYSIRRVQKA